MQELWDGTQAFRSLFDNRFVPIKDWDSLNSKFQIDPESCMCIILGNPSALNAGEKRLPISFEDFVRGGGALLVASDHDEQEVLSMNFGVKIIGKFVEVIPEYGYKNKPQLPVVLPVEGTEPRLSLKIATNKPAYILPDYWPALKGLKVIQQFPPSAHLPSDLRKKPTIFSLGGKLGKGKVLILSDHSIFINQMMMPTDTENFEFARNCMEWLSEGGIRKNVLLIIDGKPIESFDAWNEDQMPPIPPIEELVPFADRVLHEMEQDNAINKFVFSNTSTGEVIRALLLFLTAALIVVCFLRLRRAHHQGDPATPLLSTSLAQLTPSKTMLEQRNKELLGGGNLWEAARELSRQWFENQGILNAHGWKPDGPEPAVITKGTPWQRWKRHRQIDRLWSLACNTEPRRINAKQFEQLVAELDMLALAIGNGLVRLTSSEIAKVSLIRGRA